MVWNPQWIYEKSHCYTSHCQLWHQVLQRLAPRHARKWLLVLLGRRNQELLGYTHTLFVPIWVRNFDGRCSVYLHTLGNRMEVIQFRFEVDGHYALDMNLAFDTGAARRP